MVTQRLSSDDLMVQALYKVDCYYYYWCAVTMTCGVCESDGG